MRDKKCLNLIKMQSHEIQFNAILLIWFNACKYQIKTSIKASYENFYGGGCGKGREGK